MGAVASSGLRRKKRWWYLAVIATIALTIPMTAHALSYQYWSGSVKEDTWKSQAAFGTINGGFSDAPCGTCTAVIKTVLQNGSTYAQASAYGTVTLSHAYVYSKSLCEWYFGHIGQSATIHCSYTF